MSRNPVQLRRKPVLDPVAVASSGVKPVSYGSFEDPFLEELAAYIGSRRVLEVYAGNGLLASLLTRRGVEIFPTTVFASHDGHDRGMYFDVAEMDAAETVRRHGPACGVLLVSWPTTTSEAMTAAAMEWGSERPIVFIGEITQPELGNGGLGGCATDLFFESTETVAAFGSYRARSFLEKAVVMHARPDYVERYAVHGLSHRSPFGFG